MSRALLAPTAGPGPDGIDLVEIARTLRRGWKTIAAWTVAGLALSAAVVVLAPSRFESSATVVLKTSDPGGALLSKVGMGGGGGAGGGFAVPDVGSIGGMLGASMKSPLETELQILQSRAVAREVIDSLLLQARVREPRGVPTTAVVQALQLAPVFKRARYEVTREAGGQWRVRTPAGDVRGAAGAPLRLPVGTVVLRGDTTLPAAFQLELLDREDATRLFQKRLGVSKAGGEVTKVAFKAGDPTTAASVPNAIVAAYLKRRKTVDRGINEHRAEFLAAQSDSVARELAAAEHALRRQQEESGVLDAMIVGKVQVEQAALLRKSLGELDVEHGAVRKLLGDARAGTLSGRQLAAFPTFLRSPGIAELIKQLNEVEVQRTKLLERRTEEDPEVIALAQSAQSIERQLVPLASAYEATLAKQRLDVSAQLDTMRAMLGVLPGAAESGTRLQRNMIRLGTIYAALQAQLVEARLAAIGEGGDVRQLDVAEPSKKPVFPQPMLVGALGLVGGLATGLLMALLGATLGRYARDPREIERHVGVPALRFDAREPLMLGSNAAARTVLLVPLGRRADTRAVAERLAQTAAARGAGATILDLAESPPPPSIPVALRELEAAHELTLVRLPGLGADVTAAALDRERPVLFVAPAGRVDRVELANAVESLRRLDVPCAGVVLSDEPAGALRAGLRARLASA
ncbi:MAG TPA: Wzz/FepE/Etk N-terminal domain-containing protein [Gemmatimonadaceae bacterium]|nr:Wzz/FepE/Etk N-terminal domain-containing protein [Gemmatimonadaceae bacterium]